MIRAGQTLSQVAMHMTVAFGVMYACTGSLAFGGLAAIVEPVCNVALMPLHDRLWARIRTAAERSTLSQAFAATPGHRPRR